MASTDQELLRSVKKIELYLQGLLRMELAERLSAFTNKDREVYYLTGKKTQPQIVKTLQISSKTLTKLWTELEEKGIIWKDEKKYHKWIEE